VSSLDVSNDGKYLISGTTDGIVELWDVEKGRRIARYMEKFEREENISSVKITSDGRYIASCAGEIVYLWKFQEGEGKFKWVKNPLAVFKGLKDNVNSVEITKDGKYVISGSDDKTVKIWKRGYKKPIYTITTHNDGISEVKKSADGSYLATREYNSPVIKIWKLNKIISLGDR